MPVSIPILKTLALIFAISLTVPLLATCSSMHSPTAPLQGKEKPPGPAEH